MVVERGEGAPLLLMVSMIVANSKEKKWETGGEGFGITTEKDFAPYIALQNNASKISEAQQHPCPRAQDVAQEMEGN